MIVKKKKLYKMVYLTSFPLNKEIKVKVKH